MIFIDDIIFKLQKYGGISVYFEQLLQSLDRSDLTFSTGLGTKPDLSGKPQPDFMGRITRYLDCQVPARANLFHSSYYRNPSNSKVPTVVTVHDFTYERFVKGVRRSVHSSQKARAIRRADVVICVSESTKADLLEFLPDTANRDVRVIHNGVSDSYFKIESLSTEQCTSPFFLYVGNRKRYKQFYLAVRALERFPRHSLVCVGGGPFKRTELQDAGSEYGSRVKWIPFLPEEELNLLYNQATCLLHTSRYEGFGLTVVEAMRAGCPVVAKRCLAVSEIAEGYAFFFEDEDIEELSHAISLAENSRNSERVTQAMAGTKKFTWATAHNQTLNLYRELI